MPEYCLINKYISESTIIPEKQVYIYIPENESFNENKTEQVEKVYEQLANIKFDSENIEFLYENPEQIKKVISKR